MCWGGWGLAASCLTSSSPIPRLEPVTRTLRASADISAVSVPGGDTQQDCHLLGVKMSQAQPRVWLWAPMGTGTVPAPALAPHLPRAEPGSSVDQGLHGTHYHTSPALPPPPPLNSSEAPAPRVPATDGEGSPPPRAWKSTWKRHQEAENQVQIWLWPAISQFRGVSLGSLSPGMLMQSPSWEVQEGHFWHWKLNSCQCFTQSTQEPAEKTPSSLQPCPPNAGAPSPQPLTFSLLDARQPKRCLQSLSSCSPDQPGDMNFSEAGVSKVLKETKSCYVKSFS